MWQIVGIAKRKRERAKQEQIYLRALNLSCLDEQKSTIYDDEQKKNLEQKAKEKRKYLIEIGRYRTQSQLSLSLFRLPNALRLRSYRVRRFLRVKNDEQRKGGLKKIYCLFKLFYCENVEFSQPVCGDRARQTEKNESYWNESAQWTVCEIWTRRSSHWRYTVPRPIGEMSRVSDSRSDSNVLCCRSFLLPYRRALRRLTHTKFSQMVASSRSSDSVIADWMWFFEKIFCCCSVGDLTPRL